MMRSLIYTTVALLAAALLGWWLFAPMEPELDVRDRVPRNHPSQADLLRAEENLNPGTLIPGNGTPSDLPGLWPCFRGSDRDGIAEDVTIDEWGQGGPRVLWRVNVGEGHAGAAVRDGRVYLLDYDEERKEDVVRCLSLADGTEIWRFTYYVKVKRNHGMSRTVPAVGEGVVVTLGPKGHVVCLDAQTGQLLWKTNLVLDYGAKVPEWYAGQCPLIDEGMVIIAPGGEALMFAAEPRTGKLLWKTPNPDGWQMAHSSILPIQFEGRRQYVWCADQGVVGVDGETGGLLWRFPDWRIKIATVPTPVDLGDGRLLFSGGYGAGAMMVRLEAGEDGIAVRKLFETKPKVFGSDQQTPIYFEGLVYGVIPGGKLACLTPDGRQLWAQGKPNLGLGPYVVAGGRILAMDGNPPVLYLFEIGPEGPTKLAEHQVLDGHDAWAPMAVAGDRVILRDLTTLICLQIR